MCCRSGSDREATAIERTGDRLPVLLIESVEHAVVPGRRIRAGERVMKEPGYDLVGATEVDYCDLAKVDDRE